MFKLLCTSLLFNKFRFRSFIMLNKSTTTQHTCKTQVIYSPDAMVAGINGGRIGAMSRSAACRAYNIVLKTTLLDKLTGSVPVVPTPI